MSGPYGDYLKAGACQHEGCLNTWPAGPRTQKYCKEHKPAAERRYNRKHYRRHKKKRLEYSAQYWRKMSAEQREKYYEKVRQRYADRKREVA